MLVTRKDSGALSRLDGDRSDFAVKTAGGDRSGGPLLRTQRELVLLFPRDLVLAGEEFGSFAHHHF